MRALVSLCRSLSRYELHATHNCACVALVKEVPAPALAATAGEEESGEAACGGGSGVGHQQGATISRAKASGDARGPEAAGSSVSSQNGQNGQEAAAGAEQLREAMRRGSVSELLELGVPRPEAGGLRWGVQSDRMARPSLRYKSTHSSSPLPSTCRAAGACAPGAVGGPQAAAGGNGGHASAVHAGTTTASICRRCCHCR